MVGGQWPKEVKQKSNYFATMKSVEIRIFGEFGGEIKYLNEFGGWTPHEENASVFESENAARQFAAENGEEAPAQYEAAE